MEKKYVKVNFNLSDSKKRTITVKTIQAECSDENLKDLAGFIANFVEGTKDTVTRVVETTLE